MDSNHIENAIKWAYSTAVIGSDGKNIEELVKEFNVEGKSPIDQIDEFINWLCAKVGLGSFAAGLGGFITMPISLPAAIGVNLYINIRLVAGIAYISILIRWSNYTK